MLCWIANALRGAFAGEAQDGNDNWTQATTQELRWRAGVNRQAQPQAQEHQVAASQAAAKKRKAGAMSEEERKAKRAAHARVVRAEKAAAAAAAAAEAAAAARVPDRRRLNHWLKEQDEEPCDADEWDAFETFVSSGMLGYDISELEDLDDEELEQVLLAPLASHTPHAMHVASAAHLTASGAVLRVGAGRVRRHVPGAVASLRGVRAVRDGGRDDKQSGGGLSLRASSRIVV